ncbi:response regulator transcription factor [Ectobacillus funiculus]|uniref:Response regulator n=1 Tax=Ectobacillus funiculus TaxID=137993 RepID=A0ABV5WMH5_9BACI
MKVLVVDDEQHVREGIRLLGDWERYGIDEIYEAANGEEALRLIQTYKPDIIFSDMKMPKMDGIELLERIKKQHPTCKTIFVTGYDDYHYMRKAIHFGSFDYILKPIDPEILNQTLEHAVIEWKKEEAERKKHQSSHQLINEMKPIYRDRMLTKFINNDTIKDNLYEEFGFHLSQDYTAALVRVSGKSIANFQGDRDLTYFTILNVINEIVTKYECGIGFRYLSNKGEAVIIFWDKFEQIDELLVHIYQTLKTVLSVSCPIALGSQVDQSSKLIDSYHHAKQLLLNSNILSTNKEKVYIHKLPVDTDVKSLMAYSSDIELAVQAGEISAFQEVIERITKDFTQDGFLSFKQLIHFEKEYQIISNTWTKKYGLPSPVTDDVAEYIDVFFDQNGTFRLEKYIARKTREVALFLTRVKRRSTPKSINIIYDIEKYLQANFDRDVKLQEIAERFYLSREYISRKFKQEFKENISDYIVKIRMNRAKALLKNKDFKIYEIAHMVGYQDDKYFRKVFKKVEGVTPNDYRSLLFESN